MMSVHPSIILADTVRYDSFNANSVTQYYLIDEHDDEFIMDLTGTHYKVTLNKPDEAQTLERIRAQFKALLKIKRKNKEQLILLGKLRSFIKACREMLKTEYEGHLRKTNLWELLPFFDEDIFMVSPLYYFENDFKENAYVPEMVNNFTDKDVLLCLGQEVEQLLAFSHTASPDVDCDFIKIPLWDFPTFSGTTYEKMKHSRTDLQPAFAPFKEQLDLIQKYIHDITFAKDNIFQLKNYCQEKLQPFIHPIQHAIDKSLYLAQQRNKFDKNIGIQLNLGIASTETVINFYEKAGVIQAYVSSEIKHQLSKYMKVNTSYVFIYYEAHT